MHKAKKKPGSKLMHKAKNKWLTQTGLAQTLRKNNK